MARGAEMKTTTAGPVLVTGVPRSGTTWLARLLAHSSGTALAGREPMNPRGHQYGLGGTLHGWARLEGLTERQRRALTSAYRGTNPQVFSRYGRRQWAAPLPGTRMVVKDPFALLSLPVVTHATDATAVLVYRHPGAVLASYRRMGWSPDLAELQRVIEEARAGGGPNLPDLPAPDSGSDAEQMGRFWSSLHEFALGDAPKVERLVVVSHEDLALGGAEAGLNLAGRLGLEWNDAMARNLAGDGSDSGDQRVDQRLHRFDRAPSEVANAWRRHVTDDDLALIEAVTATTRAALDARRTRLGQKPVNNPG